MPAVKYLEDGFCTGRHMYPKRRRYDTLASMTRNRLLRHAHPFARQRGFTVPELLVTMLIAIGLIVLSFWVAHPRDYTAVENNATRWHDVAQIVQILRKYNTDNGTLPAGLPANAQEIGDAKDGVDLCKAFVPKYIKDIPLDPTDGGQYALTDCQGTADNPGKYVTGYTIQLVEGGTVTVAAPHAQRGEHISLSVRF